MRYVLICLITFALIRVAFSLAQFSFKSCLLRDIILPHLLKPGINNSRVHYRGTASEGCVLIKYQSEQT